MSTAWAGFLTAAVVALISAAATIVQARRNAKQTVTVAQLDHAIQKRAVAKDEFQAVTEAQWRIIETCRLEVAECEQREKLARAEMATEVAELRRMWEDARQQRHDSNNEVQLLRIRVVELERDKFGD